MDTDDSEIHTGFNFKCLSTAAEIVNKNLHFTSHTQL